MITKISKLKDFGIFYDYSWDKDLPEFKRFNLIFGWNRSGKTSISRILASLEKNVTYDKEKFKRYPQDGVFEIKSSDGITIKSADVTKTKIPIKVFNQDFIEDNISFDPSETCNPIVYISEEDIESKKLLDKHKIERIPLHKTFESATKERLQKEEIKNSFLTSLGREVANAVFDKSYNKVKAESKINEVGIDNFNNKVLSDKEKKEFESISKSDPRKELQLIQKPQIKFLQYDSLDKIYNAVKALLEKQIVSETIERLKVNLDLNKWTKEGYDLQISQNEFEKCLFCRNSLQPDFLSTLSKHFSEDYRKMQELIMFYNDNLKNIEFYEVELENPELYTDLKSEYKNKAEELNKVIIKIKSWLQFSIIAVLDKKYKDPFNIEVVELLNKPDLLDQSFFDRIDELNKIISKHNESVKNHPLKVKEAKERIELHTISVALGEQDFKKINIDLEEVEQKEKFAKNEVDKLDTEIQKLENKTSNIGKAIKEINNHLEDFFGKVEIELKLDKDNKGYLIIRNGKPASNLSEGEKTAIAFSYFIAKVREKDNKVKDSIIFIDDPISSLDSNFIYHCFALITTQFQDVSQLFISTHNFQLLNLTKEWLLKKNNQISKDNEKRRLSGAPLKIMPAEFFMIENFHDGGIRKAKLISLDNTIKKYKSEYHYLFSLLNRFKDADIDYADFYTIGNVARRFFDIYSDFKIPDLRDQKQKMESIVKDLNSDKEKISAVEWNKAYKLINEYSHNSDPTSSIEHKDKIECKDAINIILRIVQESDPKHFEILEKTLI